MKCKKIDADIRTLKVWFDTGELTGLNHHVEQDAKEIDLLVDTIQRKWPMPPVLVLEDDNQAWHLLDGHKRLRSMMYLALDIRRAPIAGGLVFSGWAETEQREFMRYEFSVWVISEVATVRELEQFVSRFTGQTRLLSNALL